MPKKDSTSLISVADLFRNSWKLYQKSWVTLLILSLITVAIWRIWLAIVLPLLLITTGLGSLAVGAVTLNPAQVLSIAISGLLIILVSLLVVFEVGFLGSASIIICLNEYLKGKRPTLGKILTEGKNLLLPLTFVSLLVFFVETVGFFLLVIPGIILVIFLQFSNFVLVTEKKTGFDVLGRSIHLVKSHFWGILGRYLVIGVASLIVNLMFSRIPAFQFASQTLVLPFTVTYHFLLYRDVVERSR
ncbi:hypothetical protein HZB96_04825 [Candidatus Gottesmanbacteria bacterium]|nr:hypothetical protein [Candidatus Gottesmanbacteria bacterium]MBI5452403.1 hypothetical protein [Candidatus Gottesmanbacteria bacterium]